MYPYPIPPTPGRHNYDLVITPEIAREWLKRNVHNRKLRPFMVAKYKRVMERGEWGYTGEPIKFDWDGNMIDGQHRTSAIAEMPDGFTIEVEVKVGLDPDSQINMDQGAKRLGGDQLQLLGYKNANNLASSVKQYIIWESGYLFRDNKIQAVVASISECAAWIDDHPDEVLLFQESLTHLRHIPAPISVSGAAFLIFAQIDPGLAKQFVYYLAEMGLPQGNPITTLNKRLQRLRNEGVRYSNRDLLALFIQSWNALRDGREITKFQRPRGGKWTAETFPEPH